MGSSAPVQRGGKAEAGLVRPIRVSTGSLPGPDQFEAWRAFMSPAIEVSIEGRSADPFVAEQTVWNLSSLAVAYAALPANGRMRTWRHLDRNPLDHWCLVIAGPTGRDGGMAPAVGPSLFIRSLARPFEGRSSDGEVISVYMPRDVFVGEAELIDRLPDRLPDGPLAALLCDYFTSLNRRLPGIAAADLPKLVEATRMLLSACLAGGGERMEEARDVIAASLVDRARRIVQQNLAAPNFGPPQLSRMLGVSRSRLYRLFEPHGGVTHYVQRQRMLAAHHALADPLNNAPVGRIAERVGFTDPSGFSRAFRQQFGYSPSQARAGASAGLVQPPIRRGEASSFADVLSRLGS